MTAHPLPHHLATLPRDVAPGTCSCGCGRKPKGLRNKAADKVADRMRRDLVLLSGALADGFVEDPAAVEALLAEGVALVAVATARVHGEIARDDQDRDAVKAWLDRVQDLRSSVLTCMLDRGFVGPVRSIHRLGYGGERAPGVVVAVKDLRVTVNADPKIRVTIEVRPARGTAFELSRSVTVSRIAFPRVGDHVEVAFDPADPDDFVYRPAAAPAPAPTAPADDRIAALQALADLHAAGVLDADELAAEKRRILGTPAA